MRINKLDKVFQVYNKNSETKKVKSDNSSKEKDQLKISEKAIEFQYGLQKLKDVEEIRQEKVDKIKAQIKSGTYYVESHKIAEKILEDINFDRKI